MLFAYKLHTCNIQVSVAEEDRCVLPSIFNPKKLLCTCKVSSSPALHIPRVCPNRTHATTQASFRRGLCSHALAVAEHYMDGPSIERMSRKIFRERKSHGPKLAKPGQQPHLPHSSTPHPSLIQANPTACKPFIHGHRPVHPTGRRRGQQQRLRSRRRRALGWLG